MYFTGVLLVAAIQNPYPLEYFFHFPEYKSSFWEAFLSKLSQPEVKMHFRAAEVVLSRSWLDQQRPHVAMLQMAPSRLALLNPTFKLWKHLKWKLFFTHLWLDIFVREKDPQI